MTQTTLPARQTRARMTQTRLLEAAFDTLNRYGVEGTTVPRIAKRAGVAAGTVYRRFADKDALLKVVCIEVLERANASAEPLLEPDRWIGVELGRILHEVITASLATQRAHRRALRALLFFSMQHPDRAFTRRFEELQWVTFRRLGSLILSRRSEIRHPDPDNAVKYALLTAAVMIRGIYLVPPDLKQMTAEIPDLEAQLQRELPAMLINYLGVEN